MVDSKKAGKIKGEIIRMGLALLFMVGIMLWTSVNFEAINNHLFIVVAAVFGAYMAINIGANDVANNVGPAVGAGAMSLIMAVIIAAIFEASGSLIAGGDVVGTIKKGIISQEAFSSPDEFVWAMTAALFAAALWLNLATYFKAPVSTTHSIVGGVMGAGIAAAGFSIVSWGTMGKIALSWVISPLIGGGIAALFLYVIKKNIINRDNKLEAAKKVVPLLVSIMAWAFGTYLMIKGVKKIVKVNFVEASLIGFGVAVVTYAIVRPIISSAIKKLPNDRESINKLFTIPLVFAAALLSFSHGANDVANAVGPLAGIYDTIVSGAVSAKATIPVWIMAVGGLGIAVGLLLYGPRLIKTVGSEITELDPIRAYSIAMAAALTVIVASQLGLPVSSTHIAVGGVFGVGFLREYLDRKRKDERQNEEQEKLEKSRDLSRAISLQLSELEAKENKNDEDYRKIVSLQKELLACERDIQDIEHRILEITQGNYVERNFVTKIVSAWIITVPAAAVLSALIFFVIKGMML